MMASNMPMKKRSVARPAKELQAESRSEHADHPTEQAERYLALGRRWMSQEEGNIPTKA